MALSCARAAPLWVAAALCVVALGCGAEHEADPGGPGTSNPLAHAVALSLHAVLRHPDEGFLAQLSSGRDTVFLPLDACQAWVVTATLEHQPATQPTARDLFLAMSDSLAVSLDHLLLDVAADGLPTALLYLRVGSERRTLDAACSDALAIAQRSSAPLLGTPGLMDAFGRTGGTSGWPASGVAAERSEAAAAALAPAQEERVAMRFLGLADQQVDVAVVLVDAQDQTVLPVFVNYCQAEAIYAGLHDPQSPAARRHGLLRDLASLAQAEVAAATIVDLVDASYFGTVEVRTPRGLVPLNARPSDALALAALTHAPVYVAAHVLQSAGEQAAPYLEFFAAETGQ